MPINKPFWLSNSNNSKNILSVNKEHLIASYHSFKLADDRYDLKSTKIPNYYILRFLEEYLEANYDKKLSKALSLIEEEIISIGKKT